MAEESVEKMVDREVSATTRWGVGLMVTILIQAGAIFFWAATIQAQVAQNTEDIDALQTKVESIEDDIRDILVGIEQVKARLGIVEVK